MELLGKDTACQLTVLALWDGQALEERRFIEDALEKLPSVQHEVADREYSYDGELFKLQRGFRLLFPPVRNHIPIAIASISPKSMEQVGEIADAWMPIFWPKSKIQDGKDVVRRGARKAGRPDDAVECWANITVVIDSDPERAKARAAGPVSWYVTNMGDFYWQMLARNGFAEEVAAMRKAAETSKPAPFQTTPEIMAAMGDRLLDEVAIYGDLETVAVGLEERRRLGVDLPIISMPPGDLHTVERVLGTLVA